MRIAASPSMPPDMAILIADDAFDPPENPNPFWWLYWLATHVAVIRVDRS